MVADAHDFIKRRNSSKCFPHSILEQAAHASLPGNLANGLSWLAGEGHLTYFRVHGEHFKNALSPAVTRSVAVFAAFATHKCSCFHLFRGNAGRIDLIRRW